MKRLLILVLLLAVGFYAAWPAFSAYQIHQGLKSGNAARVAGKIDFDQLRVSLRPTVEQETEKAVDQALAKAGSVAGGLAPGLKQQMMPKLVDKALAMLVTPEVMIRIYREGGNVKETVKRIVSEQSGKMGGIGALGDLLSSAGNAGGGGSGGALDKAGLGALADRLGGSNALGGLLGKKQDAAAAQPPPAEPAAAPPEEKAARYGLSNIKDFGFDGPLGLKLGVAKDPAAAVPDITAHMAFTGGDWKLVGLVPRAR